jgi:hypothetical protein
MAQSPESKDMNTEAEESTGLVTASKQRLVKTQHTGKAVCCSEL